MGRTDHDNSLMYNLYAEWFYASTSTHTHIHTHIHTYTHTYTHGTVVGSESRLHQLVMCTHAYTHEDNSSSDDGGNVSLC